jgi:Aminotransferase class-V
VFSLYQRLLFSSLQSAQPILRRFGVESTVRASLALYNTHEDIDRLFGSDLESAFRTNVDCLKDRARHLRIMPGLLITLLADQLRFQPFHSMERGLDSILIRPAIYFTT